MPNPLATRLQRFIDLDVEERSLLERFIDPAKAFAQGGNILPACALSSDTFILTSGFACEYRVLRDGGRQIIRLLIPGDLFGQNASILRTPRSCFIAQTDCGVVTIHEQAIDRLMEVPRLAKSWVQSIQFDYEALQESVVRIGSLAARARIAHFLCETYYRMEAKKLVKERAFRFPMVQSDLADLLGLSTVHTNRNLRSLADIGVIAYNQRSVTVLDEHRLVEIAEFSNDYLVSPSEPGLKDAGKSGDSNRILQNNLLIC